MTRFITYLCLVGAAAGCSKKETSDQPASKPAASTETAPKPSSGGGGGGGGDYPAEFAAWDMPARAAAWQGAWAGAFESAGDKSAWQIAGTQVTLAGAKGEKKLELKLESPCSAKFVEKTADGATSSTTAVFTLKDGQLITGLGDAGQRKGDSAVVCGGGSIFTLDAKGCTKWEDDFGRIKSSPGECSIAKDGDKETFIYKTNGMESKLLVEGDVIWSEQLKNTHATKHPDLAAAKTAQGL